MMARARRYGKSSVKTRVGIATALLAGGAVAAGAVLASSHGAATTATSAAYSSSYNGNVGSTLSSAMGNWNWSQQSSYTQLAQLTQASSHGAATTATSAAYSSSYNGNVGSTLSSAMGNWNWSQQSSYTQLAQLTQVRQFGQSMHRHKMLAAQRGIVVLATRKFLIVQSANGSLAALLVGELLGLVEALVRHVLMLAGQGLGVVPEVRPGYSPFESLAGGRARPRLSASRRLPPPRRQLTRLATTATWAARSARPWATGTGRS